MLVKTTLALISVIKVCASFKVQVRIKKISTPWQTTKRNYTKGRLQLPFRSVTIFVTVLDSLRLRTLSPGTPDTLLMLLC